MRPITQQALFLILIVLPFNASAQTAVSVVDLPEVDMNRVLFEKANTLRKHIPDSAQQLFELCVHNFMENRDTLNAIYVLIEQAEAFGHQARYKDTYDKLWTALLLADAAHLETAKAKIYVRIGRYYSFYKRKAKAMEYFDLSLEINRRLVASGQRNPGLLADNYYAYCSTYRELEEPEQAQVYLDSCYLFHSERGSEINILYLKFEEGFLLSQAGKYDEALNNFRQMLPWLKENNPGYQVLVYTYMGDTYRRKGDFAKSEECFLDALNFSKKYNSHIDFTPLIHERLADLYYREGNYQSAFQSLLTVKELDERFFDSRSQNNVSLLEILDEFRLEKQTRKEIRREQRLEQLEHEEKVLFLQRTILMVSMGFIVLIGILYLKHLQSKHRTEKRLIKKKQELEIQKANEIVQLKNKELSASTLKLIEKEEFIITLKDKLSQKNGNVNFQEIQRIVHSMSVGNQQNWEEFEARFINVNRDFYHDLKQSYPRLTQGDLKLCALIKLNFTSKDMARLMGISVESVHTTRYRLRKKLGLERNINLTEFIANI